MSSQTSNEFDSLQNPLPRPERGRTEKPINTLSTVSSFTAHSGEFVLWFILGTESGSEMELRQMAAKEIMAWDREFAEYLSGMERFDSLLAVYKRIEQANQAACRSGKAFVVIVNYELIKSEFVKELIEGHISVSGQAITFILISGQDITVGIRAKSKLRQPAGPHFQLTREDMRVYYTAIGVILGDEILDRILHITQGETVLVSRLGECLKPLQPLDNADVDSALENLSTIFMLEYYQPCSKDLRQLQVLLSLLDDFTMELLCELTAPDIENVQKLLHGHVFIHHNLQDDAYHIQKLYRDFLRNQLPELPKKLRFGFLRRAAQWHEDKGDYLRAVRYYALCSDYEKMISPVRKIHALYLDYDSSEILLAVLDQIPAASKDSYPEFELVRCIALYNIAKESEALRCLSLLQENLEQKDRTSDEDAVLGNVYLTFALRAWRNGLPEYLGYIVKASAHLQGMSKMFGFYSSTIVGNVLRFKEMHSGDLMAMKDAALQSIPYIRKVLPAKCGTCYLAAAEAHLFRMEFEEAGLYAGKAIEASKAFRQWGTLCETYYLLQRMSMAIGDLGEIISFKDQINDYCRTQNVNGNGSIDRVSQTHFYISMGLYHKVRPWIDQEHLKPTAYMRRGEIGRELYLHALYLFLTLRQYYPAIFFIDQSMPACYENGLWNYWLRLIVLKAVIYSTLGRSAVAVRFLGEAYRLSEANGIIFTFVEFGVLMEDLLEDVKAFPSNIDPLWIQNIQEKTAQYVRTKKLVQETYLSRHPEHSIRKLDKLTGREFLALKHLCNGLSNEEIAKQMKIKGVSVYHYLSLAYKKLGATGHNDAVRIAVLEGILDMSTG